MRITAAAPIEEPVVEVSVSAGCERRFVRRFTVFADPPSMAAPGFEPARVADEATSSVSTALAPEPAAVAPTGAARGARAMQRAAGASPPARARIVRKGPTMALANELAPPPPSASARHAVDNGSARKPGPRFAAAPPADAPRLVLDRGYAHLKLDMEEPVIPVATGASGAGASIALTDLDDPDARQLRALEQSIQAIKRDSEAARDQAARMQAQLAEAQTRNEWLPYIVGLLLIALAAAAALAWKLRQQSRRLTNGAWFSESQVAGIAPPVTAPVPLEVAPPPAFVAEGRRDAGPSTGGELIVEPPGSDMSGAPSVGVVSDVSATRPLDRSTLAGLMAQEPSAPRELSVEELLDLEQQADFFIALGQEDAAVDLLMSHLRSAGGQSPLPYTKLLEIYRRQGDRSAYERTRARFNRRFNAYAPDWDTGPSAGRTLEDYPDTVALVQLAWHSPIDAMAVLEGLLFKRDDTSELFDLTAYRDVLVLYSLARDLWQQGGGDAGAQVDVLLPLDDADYAAFLPQTPYAPARRARDPDLPLDTRGGMLTSFEMTGFDAGGESGRVDLEIPAAADSYDDERRGDDRRDEGVHATLDALSLAPVEPSKVKPSPVDREGGAPPPDASPPPGKR